jgi:hypothetical protein
MPSFENVIPPISLGFGNSGSTKLVWEWVSNEILGKAPPWRIPFFSISALRLLGEIAGKGRPSFNNIQLPITQT